jgi:hypothetical protein
MAGGCSRLIALRRDGLARAGRSLNHEALAAGLDGSVDLADDCLLVRRRAAYANDPESTWLERFGENCFESSPAERSNQRGQSRSQRRSMRTLVDYAALREYRKAPGLAGNSSSFAFAPQRPAQ